MKRSRWQLFYLAFAILCVVTVNASPSGNMAHSLEEHHTRTIANCHMAKKQNKRSLTTINRRIKTVYVCSKKTTSTRHNKSQKMTVKKHHHNTTGHPTEKKKSHSTIHSKKTHYHSKKTHHHSKKTHHHSKKTHHTLKSHHTSKAYHSIKPHETTNSHYAEATQLAKEIQKSKGQQSTTTSTYKLGATSTTVSASSVTDEVTHGAIVVTLQGSEFAAQATATSAKTTLAESTPTVNQQTSPTGIISTSEPSDSNDMSATNKQASSDHTSSADEQSTSDNAPFTDPTASLTSQGSISSEVSSSDNTSSADGQNGSNDSSSTEDASVSDNQDATADTSSVEEQSASTADDPVSSSAIEPVSSASMSSEGTNGISDSVSAQSVNEHNGRTVDAEPQSKIIGISVGAIAGCVAAAGLAGMFVYRRRQSKEQESDVVPDELNTRYRTQSFMAVVAGAVARLPKHNDSSRSSRSSGVMGTIRRAASKASKSLSRSGSRSSQQSYGVAVSGPMPSIAHVDGSPYHTHAY
ncbi:hypothetical protein G6F55_011973 [Rhizopus delemar]|uniref:Mid2 domain-containing protein n=2 Tax=Rhizopus TaxID=4842 RepID=A0A9P7CSH2_9FUNG|nr:hypothetical protein G6F55_011973 [Rhizopus delemar]KAG1549072.1 hypothetical protein G6F51_003286 [Rhizopus arrhizus]KAG1518042.1 hypothetical protein G6F52_009110 [Rhizopus delemar]KAG1558250.1 hypothetical protein G6F49_004663 [Rhizopus delemar]KAG1573317.1 hypothetical protein G6F50_002965 [Rhizopus delemar]